jgi:hypothetical protein
VEPVIGDPAWFAPLAQIRYSEGSGDPFTVIPGTGEIGFLNVSKRRGGVEEV